MRHHRLASCSFGPAGRGLGGWGGWPGPTSPRSSSKCSAQRKGSPACGRPRPDRCGATAGAPGRTDRRTRRDAELRPSPGIHLDRWPTTPRRRRCGSPASSGPVIVRCRRPATRRFRPPPSCCVSASARPVSAQRSPGASRAPIYIWAAGILRAPALIAQGIEHRFPKPGVVGSNPTGGTFRGRAGRIRPARRLLSVTSRVVRPRVETDRIVRRPCRVLALECSGSSRREPGGLGRGPAGGPR